MKTSQASSTFLSWLMAQAAADTISPVSSDDRARAIQVQRKAISDTLVSQIASSGKTAVSLLSDKTDGKDDDSKKTDASTNATTASVSVKPAVKTSASYTSVTKAYADHTMH